MQLIAFLILCSPSFAPDHKPKPETHSHQELNGLRLADKFSGSDIGAKVNSAFLDCSNQCTVYIPAGTYKTVTTTVSIPVSVLGSAALWIDPAAIINYAGSSDFIQAFGTGQAQANVRIFGGGRIIGTSSAASGIHLRAFNRAWISDVRIEGFSSGDGIKNEGANSIEINNVTLLNNSNGLHNVGVNVSSTPFSVNAEHVTSNQILGNTNAGIYDDAAGIANGPNSANVYRHNTFEENGTTGSATTGAWLAKSCVNCEFSNNYVETATNKPVSTVIIGDTGAQTFNTSNIIVANNAFASAGSTQSILVQNGIQHHFYGNNEGATGQTNFLKETGHAAQLVIGLNSASNISNANVYSIGGAGNEIYYGPTVSGVGAWYATATGIAFNSISGSAQDLEIRERASSGGNIINFRSFGGTAVGSLSNTGKANFNGGVVAGATGTGAFQGGKIQNGSNSEVNIPTGPPGSTLSVTIASGTSALGTSAIGSKTCSTVVSVSATNVASTDVVQWSLAGDPSGINGYGSGTGPLQVWAYPTERNVNFRVCNLNAGSITPGALSVNWRVVR